MIYIIDQQISFNSDDCTLSHLPTQETLSLSISAGRLFEKLLNSQGEILARESLLTEVWDKFGLRGSNSNLNQYLSILRRALGAYGCENLIITIPKIGIRLNTEIKIERELSSVLAEVEECPDNIHAEKTGAVLESDTSTRLTAITDNSARESSFTFRQGIYAIIVMLMLAVAAFLYFTDDEPPENNPSRSTIKLDGGCEAVIIQGLDVFEQSSLNKQILEILKENSQSCAPGIRIYFDKNTSFTTTDYGRTIISACKLNSSGHIVSCNNFYYFDWREF